MLPLSMTRKGFTPPSSAPGRLGSNSTVPGNDAVTSRHNRKAAAKGTSNAGTVVNFPTVRQVRAASPAFPVTRGFFTN